MIKIIISISLLYILPLILSWRYINVLYSNNGELSDRDPDITKLFFTICPIMNLAFSIMWLLDDPFKDHHFSNAVQKQLSKLKNIKLINYNKFFKINK